ncbi:MAG: hypothetical protein WBZ20_18570, partial [Nitrososphaeraceae archaeon]
VYGFFLQFRLVNEYRAEFERSEGKICLYYNSVFKSSLPQNGFLQWAIQVLFVSCVNAAVSFRA